MNTVKVRHVIIGEGIPKICIPIVAKTEKDIYNETQRIITYPADILELRIDWFEEAENINSVLRVLHGVREIIDDTPLLFTFRSFREGGAAALSLEQYCKLLIAAAEEKQADMIDVEIFFEGIPHKKSSQEAESADFEQKNEIIRELIRHMHRRGIIVVGSNHDFIKTPDEEEIIRRLWMMQDWDADIAKIAVMPQCEKDVLVLLSATEQMKKLSAKGPVITMSMGKQGMISRLAGEVFGSAVTFASAGRASAPGQMEARELKQVLEILHK